MHGAVHARFLVLLTSEVGNGGLEGAWFALTLSAFMILKYFIN